MCPTATDRLLEIQMAEMGRLLPADTAVAKLGGGQAVAGHEAPFVPGVRLTFGCQLHKRHRPLVFR
ncbi:hypothetical protein D9M68_100570 [compost metagenome]